MTDIVIPGLRDTSSFTTGQNRPLNWREGVMFLYPNGMASLYGLTSLMRKKTTDDPEFNWWEQALPTQRMVGDTAIDNVVTTLPLAAGAFNARDGHVLLVEETDEQMRVTATPGTDTALTVERGFAGTTATAWDPTAVGVNPNVQIIGSVMHEASDAPDAVSYEATKVRNYTQIQRHTLEGSRTARATRLRTRQLVAESKRQTMEQHSLALERTFWFGRPWEGNINSKRARTTGGVNWRLDPTMIFDGGGASGMDMETLEGYLEALFRYGSSTKMGFLGAPALRVLNQVVRKNAQMNIEPGLKAFGMNVTRLSCPFGELVLKTHPLFTLMVGGTNGGTRYFGEADAMTVLDMDKLQVRPLQGGDTQYQPKLQSNGMDGVKSGYLSEIGLEIAHPLCHGKIKDIFKAKVDT